MEHIFRADLCNFAKIRTEKSKNHEESSLHHRDTAVHPLRHGTGPDPEPTGLLRTTGREHTRVQQPLQRRIQRREKLRHRNHPPRGAHRAGRRHPAEQHTGTVGPGAKDGEPARGPREAVHRGGPALR